MDRADTGTGIACSRGTADAERAAGRAGTRRLYSLDIAGLVTQNTNVLLPRRDRPLRDCAGGLLRHAGCEATASAANDHDLRSRRHQPFREAEPVSGRLERG